MMKERYLKETKVTKIAKAKENILNVGIQITSSESVQNYQEATIKESLLEDHGVIAMKMKKKRLKTKNVLWPKLLMRSLFPPLDNPELTIRRSFHVDPTFLNNFEMATKGNGDPPVPDLQTMEELCQSSLNGQGGPIASIAILATNFSLKNDMIQQVQNSCQFHGLLGDDANKHLDKFLHVTQSIKVNGVTDDALHLCPNHNMLLVTQIDTFYNGLTLRHRHTINVAAGGTFMKRRPEECYDLIKNMTTHHNDWDTSTQRSESSSSITYSSDQEIIALKAKMAEISKNLIKVLQINQQVKVVTPSCETCGGPHSYNDCLAIVGQTQNVYAAGAYQGGNSYQPQGASHGPNPRPAYQAPGYQASVHQPPIPQPQVVTTTEFTNYMKANDAILKNIQTNMTSLTNSNLELKNMFGQFMKMNTALSSGLGTLPSNTITNPKEDFKGITTRSGNAYQGPTIPTTSSSLPKVVELKTKVTKDTVPPTNNGSTKDVQPLVVQIENLVTNSEPVIAPVADPNVAPVSAPKPNQKPSIPYTSRLHDQNLGDKTNDQKEKFFKIFQDLNFNICFADALTLMPKFGPAIKSLLTNKDKLFELARTPLNKHCSTVLLKKLPEKLGDLGKFLIPCDFPGMDECLALANLGASINLMPLSGDILLLEAFLNDDASLPPLNQGMYLPQVRKEHKIYEAKNDTSSIDEPPEVELKDLPPHLKYAFLEGDDTFPVITAKDLSVEEKSALIKVFKSHKQAIAWKLSDIKGIDLEFCTHKILMEDDFEPVVQYKRRVNLKIYDVIKKEVLKLFDAGLIYLISDSPLVSPVHSVSKKGGFTVVENEENELIPTRLVTGWRVCIGYRKLNESTRKDHFSLPFMDQMLERLAGNEYYCFLDGFLGYFQIHIDPKDQEKTTFTCPYGTFAYRRMPFGLCNALCTFQRCMMAIFHDMIEKTMEAFMDDFSVFGNSFETCLSHLEKILQLCQDTNLCLNWEKSHFMVKEGIILGHKISKKEIESSGGVFTAKKPLTFLKLATMDPPGDIMARTTRPKRCLTPVFIGPQSIEMPTTWSNLVTLVNVREIFRNVMKCLKIPSKFLRFLTFGASISWGRSRLHEGTSIYSWPSITCRNGLKRKRSPPMTPELFVNS
nr:reverse transcriptase domain-containing protein [Tanacetum cinerariifolium]